MLAFPAALLLAALVVVFALEGIGPTRTQDTHATEGGGRPKTP